MRRRTGVAAAATVGAESKATEAVAASQQPPPSPPPLLPSLPLLLLLHPSAASAAEDTVQNPAVVQKIADYTNTLNVPQSITELGHPITMAALVLAMGYGGAYIGWRGRLNTDKRRGVQQKQLHATLMGAFLPLAIIGAFGGTVSVAMQGSAVWQTAHAKTALGVLALLTANAALALSGFGAGGKRGREATQAAQSGRAAHAYLGSAILAALLIHMAFGVQMLM